MSDDTPGRRCPVCGQAIEDSGCELSSLQQDETKDELL